MNFIADYMKAIDILALVAVVAIGAASFARTGVVWLLGTAIILGDLVREPDFWMVSVSGETMCQPDRFRMMRETRNRG